MQLLIGADPELFLKRGATFLSGYDMLPGTKAVPHKVEKGALQIDGMALEFNIDPAHNADEFVTNINTVLATMRSMIPPEYEIVASAVAKFSPEYMEEQPETAKELGCDPDFNAYTMQANPRPDQHPTMRTAAGHVHIGWTKDQDRHDPRHFSAASFITRQLDCFLGLPSVLLDEDTERKQMYGKAGAFRPKPYGAEYRTLSNFWLKEDTLKKWVYDSTVAGCEQMFKEGPKVLNGRNMGKVRKVINENNKDVAYKLCKEYQIPVL